LKDWQIFTPTKGTTSLLWAPKSNPTHCNTLLN
jgi:hypothetical protein